MRYVVNHFNALVVTDALNIPTFNIIKAEKREKFHNKLIVLIAPLRYA